MLSREYKEEVLELLDNLAEHQRETVLSFLRYMVTENELKDLERSLLCEETIGKTSIISGRNLRVISGNGARK